MPNNLGGTNVHIDFKKLPKLQSGHTESCCHPLNDRRHFLTFQSFEMFERDVGATDSGSIRQINVLTKYVAIVVSKQ